MTFPLIACSLLATLLPVNWRGESGWTYTLQHSLDMLHWESVPAVFPGADAEESVILELAGSPVFARWRSSSTGDTNANGLPDPWEWSKFGMLDVDPEADPDMDGASNIEEWTRGTDPLDYFNGETAILTITCGTEWLVAPGEVSVQSVSLVLTNASGSPLPGAPVILRLPEKLGSLEDSMGTSGTEIVAHTDSLGRIHPGVHPIHYAAPAAGPSSEFLEIQAGMEAQSIQIRTTAVVMGGPPRSLTHTIDADGRDVFQWSGDPGQASAFVIERQGESGEWETITELATGNLPRMDPETGYYTLVVESTLLQ